MEGSIANGSDVAEKSRSGKLIGLRWLELPSDEGEKAPMGEPGMVGMKVEGSKVDAADEGPATALLVLALASSPKVKGRGGSGAALAGGSFATSGAR